MLRNLIPTAVTCLALGIGAIAHECWPYILCYL